MRRTGRFKADEGSTESEFRATSERGAETARGAGTRLLSRRPSAWALHLPSLGWLVVFFLLPVLVVLALAFRPPDPYGGVGEGWTPQTLRELTRPIYLDIAWRTFWLSAVATGICLLLGVPVGYYLARSPARRRPVRKPR